GLASFIPELIHDLIEFGDDEIPGVRLCGARDLHRGEIFVTRSVDELIGDDRYPAVTPRHDEVPHRANETELRQDLRPIRGLENLRSLDPGHRDVEVSHQPPA